MHNNIANGMIAIILYISSEEQNVLYNNCQVKMCFCNEITLLYILTCYFIIIWRNNSFIRENDILENIGESSFNAIFILHIQKGNDLH